MNVHSLTQQLFFQQIKARIPADISFVHEISELLGISYDSAYRRIRGEKELTLEELQKLALRYNLSIDALFQMDAGSMIFQPFAIEEEGLSFKQWLQIILKDITRIHDSHSREVIYAAKDVPIFHYFQFPEIAAFKIFLWHKTLFNFSRYQNRLFSLEEDISAELLLGRQILATSVKVPTIELWNEETFVSILRQIEYYWDSQFFANRGDVFILIDRLKLWLKHIQQQVEYGFKFVYGSEPAGIENSYKLYLNEVLLCDNTILVKMDDLKVTYLTYNVLNLLITSDPRFYRQVEETMHIMMKRSVLISGSSSRERNKFFLKLLTKVNQLQDRIMLQS